MINRRHQSRRTIVAFIVLAASLLILSQLEIDLFSDDHTSSSRRFLQSITIDEESIYSYAEKGLIPVTEPPNPKNEVSLFWHIPKVSILFFFYSLYLPLQLITMNNMPKLLHLPKVSILFVFICALCNYILMLI